MSTKRTVSIHASIVLALCSSRYFTIMPEPCQVCFEPCTKSCSVCKTAHYCSPEHSRSDWKRHKRECAVLAAGIEKQVGFPLRVKVAFFPAAGGEARIVDLPYKLGLDSCTPTFPFHQLDLSPLLGRVTPAKTRIEINGFHTGEPLGHQLQLIYNDNFLDGKCPINKCIEELHGGRGYGWRDNVILVRQPVPEERYEQYQDITEDDIKAAKNYFRQGGNGRAAIEASKALEELAFYKAMGFQFVDLKS
ncbi:hypothetical protein OH77DRAFT_1417360 [Trametes cingulata]|nr:hypothetical protein OH77DRAFT_1417360 [Trametes cingulata]